MQIRHYALIFLAAIMLPACKTDEPEKDTPSAGTDTDVTVPSDDSTPASPTEPIDTAYSATDTVRVLWSGASAEVSGLGGSVTAEVSGGDVLIRNTQKNLCIVAEGEGTGSLRLYSDYKYQLILRSLTLHAAGGPAVSNQSHKSLSLRLEGASSLSDEAGYAAQNADGEDQKACFFSEGQIILLGEGSLSVDARCRHGIASDDYIAISSGKLEVTTTSDAAKALKANEYIVVSGGQISITQSGSRVVEDNDPAYCAALRADSVIEIAGGALTIRSSAEGGRGLNADLGIIISGGTIAIKMTGNGAMGSSGNDRPGGSGGRPGGGPGGGWGGGTTGGTADDANSFTSPCIKTDGYVNIAGGTLDLTTTGIKGFGIKASGQIAISGGTLIVNTSGQGAEGIESKTAVDLQGGRVFAVSQTEDAINCAGPINFSGAWVYAVSNGNDAIDSNYGRSGAINISDGVVVAISSSGSPEEGLDCDNNSYITISGGYVFTGGGAQGGGGWGGSGASVGSATQAYCFTSGYALTSGNYYTVKNASDDVLFTVKALTSLTSGKNTLSLISAPALTKNGTNTICSASSAPASASAAWDGYIYLGGTSAAASVKTFTGK